MGKKIQDVRLLLCALVLFAITKQYKLATTVKPVEIVGESKATTKSRRTYHPVSDRDRAANFRKSHKFREHEKRVMPSRSNIYERKRRGTRRRTKNGKVIYYLHIHKSGGSTMCRQAYMQKLLVNRHKNCNVQDDQHCCGGKDSIEAQVRFANTTSYDFVACEREMYDTMATDHYDYVVTLRDSATRYLSHWNHLRTIAILNPVYDKKNGKKNRFIETSTEGPRRRLVRADRLSGKNRMERYDAKRRTPTKAPKPKPALKPINDIHDRYFVETEGKKRSFVGNFSTWLEFQPDNYNTRMICGSRCLESPKFRITPLLFEYTLQRLSLFSHILFLEDLRASYGTFAETVGWKHTSNINHDNELMGTTKQSMPEMMVEENLRYDPLMTTLDDALYAFARARYEGNYTNNHTEITLMMKHFATAEAVQEYYRDGGSRNCTSPCCGECSIW